MKRDEHLFVKLMEECAEVQQRTSKLLQFGLNEIEPGQALTNSQRLRLEINDLLSVIYLLENRCNIPAQTSKELLIHFRDKEAKIDHYLKYSETLGRVDSRELAKLQSADELECGGKPKDEFAVGRE